MIHARQIQRPNIVLVVDDQEINRDVLGEILSEVILARVGRIMLLHGIRPSAAPVSSGDASGRG